MEWFQRWLSGGANDHVRIITRAPSRLITAPVVLGCTVSGRAIRVHGRDRTRAAVHIHITPDGRKTSARGPGSEVMVWKIGYHAVGTWHAIVAAGRVNVARKVPEATVRTTAVCAFMLSHFGLHVGGLPVDWVESAVELVRRAELPFANDGPDDASSDNAGGNHRNRNNRVSCYMALRVVA